MNEMSTGELTLTSLKKLHFVCVLHADVGDILQSANDAPFIAIDYIGWGDGTMVARATI